MKLTKISTGIAAGLLTASLAVAPQAFAAEGDPAEAPAPDSKSSLSDLSSDGVKDGEGSSTGKDGEGSSTGKDGEGSSTGKDGEGSSLDDKQKKIIGGVFGGLAGLALLAGIFNFLQSQGGKLPF
ncbi:hypothetical protein [Corynebacterium sp. p3-SID1194]|uniref:hypothetical protein n=1 Tax=Corynebacterium sp. p3-SID1194 TaxID=2916105 RepID=UPI0021A8F4A3|nr:hypothetical protein [Corynebacterium sp. p3-SID1194]MCT1449239.1 hypothetical protein [Corynebacterium sp. p3-SID1194]